MYGIQFRYTNYVDYLLHDSRIDPQEGGDALVYCYKPEIVALLLKGIVFQSFI